ncbi:MAG: hypothetical protein V2J89_17570 [Halieaceae bacterium]|jgi:hypothetical protein|nr:hypothetical protein [Halieaceae bacterium]
MKRSLFYLFVLATLMQACGGPTQHITSYWANKEAIPDKPYKTIYVMAITQNENMQPAIENGLADILSSKGRKVRLNSEIYPPSFSAVKQLSKEELIETIAKTESDGILTLAVLDTKTETTYNQGSYYAPMSYGYYGSYYGYYSHYYPVVYSPGYYSEDKTYYIETNFFDVETDQLLWSIHSSAHNPASLDSFFEEYATTIRKKLLDEGLIDR